MNELCRTQLFPGLRPSLMNVCLSGKEKIFFSKDASRELYGYCSAIVSKSLFIIRLSPMVIGFQTGLRVGAEISSHSWQRIFVVCREAPTKAYREYFKAA